MRIRGEYSVTNAGRGLRVRGFTLIELMVVITIIGLASAAVVLALPDPRGRLADEAAHFAARASAARDLAVIDARPISVWVSAGGYGFDERTDVIAGAHASVLDHHIDVADMNAGRVQVLIVLGCNPAFTAPAPFTSP